MKRRTGIAGWAVVVALVAVWGSGDSPSPAVVSRHRTADLRALLVKVVGAVELRRRERGAIRGTVELTGVVRSLTGAPIAGARVQARARGAQAQASSSATDDRGHFALAVDRGTQVLEATATGYAPRHLWPRAPGAIEVVLTPASTISGLAVDARTLQPVPGARIALANQSDDSSDTTVITDERGAFRAEALGPGHYTLTASTPHGYGSGDSSTLVGVGQRVDGLVVKLVPAHQVSGRVVIAQTGTDCPGATVQLIASTTDHYGWPTRRREPGIVAGVVTGIATGTGIVLDGAPRGSYGVDVECPGYTAREPRAVIAVEDADLTGLIWEVEPGATIRGTVMTRSHEPIEGAVIATLHASGEWLSWVTATTGADGAYELAGLDGGSYELRLDTPVGAAAPDGYRVEVAVDATAELDVVVDTAGAAPPAR